MRFVVPSVLCAVALIHLLPLVGVWSAARVASLYGIAVQDPNLELLLPHRAVLFGLLAAFLAVAAFQRPLHGWALAAGGVSVGAFLLLALTVGPVNGALATMVKVDWVALALLAVGTWVHLRGSGPG